MQLDWGTFRDRAAVWSGRAGSAAVVIAVLMLGGLLVAQSAEARRERAGIERQHRALDRDLERAKRRHQDLRGEIQALASDPVYVESLLRRWRMSAPAEKIVE